MAAATERLWRLRKDHTWIDARLRDRDDDTDGVELQFFYDGSLVFARRCPTRDEALADANTYLRNLQRAGWNTHW
jgi:hypothetical protein